MKGIIFLKYTKSHEDPCTTHISLPFRHRAKSNRQRGPDFRRGPGLFMDTRSSRSPASDGTMSNSPVRRTSNLSNRRMSNSPVRRTSNLSNRRVSNSPVRRTSNLAQSELPRRSCLPTAPPIKSESAGPAARPGSAGGENCSNGLNGSGFNGPDSLDSLPSVQRVGGSDLLQEGEQRQHQSESLVTKEKEEVRRSLTLVDQTGRSPLSRRSFTLFEESGTSAWI